MKILILCDYYPIYLNEFYAKYPEMSALSFKEQQQKLFDDHFSWPSDLCRYLIQRGIDAECIIQNAEILQRQWALENGVEFSEDSHWEKTIVLGQLRFFKPDILVKINPDEGFNDLVKKAEDSFKKRIFYLGHRIPSRQCVEEADYILTAYPEKVFRIYPHIKNVANVYPVFCPDIVDGLSVTEKKYDVVFFGNISPQHKKRAEVLSHLVENGIDIKIFGKVSGSGIKAAFKKCVRSFIKGEFRKAFDCLVNDLFRSQYRKHIRTIKKVINPPVFGMECYRMLSQAHIGLNVHIDMAEGQFSGNIRMFETTGVGTCLLTEEMAGNPHFFEPDKEVLTFKSKEDLLTMLQQMDFKSERIQEIARAGQERTLRDHSTMRMCDQLMAVI